jgi:hypothetical protein
MGAKHEGEPIPETPVLFEDPAICPDDPFFSDAFRCNQGPEEFQDAIATQEPPPLQSSLQLLPLSLPRMMKIGVSPPGMKKNHQALPQLLPAWLMACQPLRRL